MKGKNMTIKRQTLNADKRKVIADIFQQHFEDNSKYKKQHSEAIETYNDMRSVAKTKMETLVRFHQPQEDVDTIRSMVNKYGESGGRLYDDNCFHVQNSTPRMDTDNNDILLKNMMMFTLSSKPIKNS